MLTLRDISVGYGQRMLVRSLDAEVAPGERVLLCGPNGSGKSSLLRVMAGLLPPLSGTVTAGERTALVPTRIPKIKGFTLRDFAATALHEGSAWSFRMDRAASRAVDEALSLLGLEPLSRRDISTLSDGEFQKGCIAAALCSGARILLLDEPTAFLDPDGRAGIAREIGELCSSQGLTLVYSSHDIGCCLPFVDRVWGLDGKGNLLQGSGAEKLSVAQACFRNKIPIFEGLVTY